MKTVLFGLVILGVAMLLQVHATPVNKQTPEYDDFTAPDDRYHSPVSPVPNKNSGRTGKFIKPSPYEKIYPAD